MTTPKVRIRKWSLWTISVHTHPGLRTHELVRHLDVSPNGSPLLQRTATATAVDSRILAQRVDGDLGAVVRVVTGSGSWWRYPSIDAIARAAKMAILWDEMLRVPP